MDATVQYLLNYGILGVLVIIGGGAIFKSAVWFRDKVATPLVDSHLSLIATLKEHAPKQTEALDEQTGKIQEQSILIEQQSLNISRQTQEVHLLTEKLEKGICRAEDK